MGIVFRRPGELYTSRFPNGANGEDDLPFLTSADVEDAKYPTRALLVLAVAAGLIGTDGTTVQAEGLRYVWREGSTYIPDLHGLEPIGWVTSGNFGAVSGAANNSSALQGAFNWSGAYGKRVYLDNGTFNCVSTLSPISNMKIIGAGMDKTIITQDLTNFASLIGSGIGNSISNVYMSDMTLNGQSFSRTTIGAAGHLFASYAFEGVTFERMKFKEALGYGIGMQGYPSGGTGKNGPQVGLTVRDCIIESCGHGKNRTTTLSTTITAGDLSITVADGTQLDALGGTIMIGNEIIRHGAVTGGTTTIARGLANTTAASHTAGATVYRLSNGDGVDCKNVARTHFENTEARYNGDNGLNVRGQYVSFINCRCYGNIGPGFGLNSVTPTEADDTSSTLVGALSDSATTIPLLDASDFPTSGTGRIDSEMFTWSGKSTNDLTGVVRGVNGTVAVAHNDLTGVAVDTGDDSYDSHISLVGCHAWDNFSAGFAAAAGSASSTTHVDFTGCISIGNAAGLNASGGTFGAEGGYGQIKIRWTGGSLNKNLDRGIILTNLEDFSITGAEIFKNVAEGINIISCANGGSVTGCDIRANGSYAIVESANTDYVSYTGGRIAGNANKISIAGANSTVTNVKGWVNEQTVEVGTFSVSATGATFFTVPLTMDVVDRKKTTWVFYKDSTPIRVDIDAFIEIDSIGTTVLNGWFIVSHASAFAGSTVKASVTVRG